MSRRVVFFFAVAGLLFAFAPLGQAALIVGSTYFDSDSVAWEYVGSFDVADGPAWSDGGQTYNGLEAAELIFGPLGSGQEYALSTSDTFVDHLAWYDGYGQLDHLNFPGQVGLAEDINEDPGNDGYNFEFFGGDWSAYISDHLSAPSDSINHVFVRDVAAVPEPASLLTFAGLSLCFGFGAWRKRRKQPV